MERHYTDELPPQWPSNHDYIVQPKRTTNAEIPRWNRAEPLQWYEHSTVVMSGRKSFNFVETAFKIKPRLFEAYEISSNGLDDPSNNDDEKVCPRPSLR
jgi:hypothetical protein